MRTSVLERLTAPLCDFVTGRNGSQEMLESWSGPTCSLYLWMSHDNGTAIIIFLPRLLRHQLEVKSGAEEVTRCTSGRASGLKATVSRMMLFIMP